MTMHPFVWLRAKTAWRGIRNRDFILTASVFGFILLVMLGGAFLAGMVGPTVQMILDTGRTLGMMLAHPILTGVFLVWVLVPFLIGARYASTGEVERLFSFPIHIGRWYALNILWGLTDPLIFMFTPTCLWILYGMKLLGGLDTCVLSLLIVLLFVLTTIACVQWIGHLLQRILTHRRASRIFHVCVWTVFLAIVTGLVIAAFRARDPVVLLSRITGSGVLRLLPPSLTADALLHLQRGEIAGFLFPLSTLCVYLVLIGWFGYRLFVRIRLEGIGPIAQQARRDRPGALERVDRWMDRTLPFVRPEARVFLAKDLVYLARWNLFKMMYPYVLLGFLGMLLYQSRAQGSESLYLWIPWCVMLITLCGLPPPPNQLGIEGAGVRHHFMAPVSRKTALVTKNVITFLAMFGFVASFLLLSFVLFKDTVAGTHWFWFIAFSTYVLFTYIGIGNVLSVLYPKAIDSKRFFGRLYSSQAMLWVIAASLALFLFPLEFAYFTRMNPRRMLLIYAGLAALAFAGNLIALGPVSDLLERRKEQVLHTLKGEDKRIWNRR